MTAVPAGLPTQLKDGDIILFGSDSQLRVHLMPASDESTTVEQHLRAECKQWTERIRVQPPGISLQRSVAHTCVTGLMHVVRPHPANLS